MIWDIVSSRSCFCWLYRASPSLAAKNIINLALVWTIWWCTCVQSSLGLLKTRVFPCGFHTVTSIFCWWNSVSLCSASFCTPRPNLPVTPGISYLPTFAFLSPIMERISFWVLVLESLVCLHRTIQLQLLQHYWSGHRLGLPWYWMILPWKRTEIILSFLRLHPSTAFQTLLLTMTATPFLLRDSCPQ